VNVGGGVLDTGVDPGPRLVDASVAFSGAATDSTGLKQITSETRNNVVPTPGTADMPVDPGGKEAYGRGSALEVGLGQDLPVNNGDQLALSERAEAAALPIAISPAGDEPPAGANANSTGLVRSEDVVIPGAPLAYVNALPNHAAAVWNERSCILGQPISYGRGRAATAQLVDTAGDDATEDLDAPLVGVSNDFFGDERGAVDTRSFTYLINNGDGTFGIAAETRMTFAPVTLLQTDGAAPAPVIVEILGEWVFRATATGKPGGASISYEVVGPSEDPDTPVIRIYLGAADASATPTIEIKRNQLFTEEGINPFDGAALPLLDAAIGEDPRKIDDTPDDPVGADATVAPTTSADGTLASGAADVVRLDLLSLAPGVEIAGLVLGHMESKAQVPAGGFKCTIPVSKTGPTSATAGDTITWTIKVPSEPDALLGLACDLVNITVTDTIKTLEGNATGTILTISAQGKSAAGNGKTATLTGLGPYKVGDPPIEVSVTARLSGSGRLENVADVTATLANCGQGTLGGQITGFADLAKVTGTAEVLGNARVEGQGTAGGTNVAVLAARLPTTGGNTALTFLGIGALLTAAGVYLVNRRVSRTTS
jgi:LPXTG-motif cell wall-anchored protein